MKLTTNQLKLLERLYEQGQIHLADKDLQDAYKEIASMAMRRDLQNLGHFDLADDVSRIERKK